MYPNTASLRVVAKTIFPISDMSEAVAFYRGLGFEVEAFDETYAWVRHNGDEILHLRLYLCWTPQRTRRLATSTWRMQAHGMPRGREATLISVISRTTRGGCASSRSPIQAAP